MIEFQGIQHFKAYENWGGEIALQSRIARDAIKNKYCADKGIPLLIIKYNDNVDKVISNYFKKDQVLTELPPALLELRKTREQFNEYQRKYHKIKYQDADYAAKKKAQTTARAAERYKTDPEYRNRRLQHQKDLYARKKKSGCSH